MRHVRYMSVLVVLMILTGGAILAAPAVDSTAPTGPPGSSDWPSLQMTYETTRVSTPGTTMHYRSLTELTYISRNEWRSEVIEASFVAGEPGSTAEFKDGVFTQNLKGAGMVITEEIPQGNYAIPERWLSPDRMERLESLGYQTSALDDHLVGYELRMEHGCDDIEPANWPDGCEAGGTIIEVESIVARTDLSAVPIPVEYSYQIGDLVVEHVTIMELTLLDENVEPAYSE